MPKMGSLTFLKSRQPLRSRQLVVAMAVAVPVGIFTLAAIFAAGSYISAEPENGTLSGNATVVSDAAASGSKAVQFGSATPTPTPTAYTFDDEFNGQSGVAPNSALWTHDVGGAGWGNQEREYYTDGNANSYLDGQGHLVIAAQSYNGTSYSCWYGPCKYTSARILTENSFSQAYGHFEARIEMPNLQSGLWPAFWALGNNLNTVGWPQCGETDIMENFGDTGIEGSLHGPIPANDTHASYDLAKVGPTAWHTYAIDWSPTQVTFSIDGIKYGTTTKSQMGADWVFDHPFFLILNMAVGGTGTGGALPANLPAEMLVDYVRVSS